MQIPIRYKCASVYVIYIQIYIDIALLLTFNCKNRNLPSSVERDFRLKNEGISKRKFRVKEQE